jgi:hypothetical protein
VPRHACQFGRTSVFLWGMPCLPTPSFSAESSISLPFKTAHCCTALLSEPRTLCTPVPSCVYVFFFFHRVCCKGSRLLLCVGIVARKGRYHVKTWVYLSAGFFIQVEPIQNFSLVLVLSRLFQPASQCIVNHRPSNNLTPVVKG